VPRLRLVLVALLAALAGSSTPADARIVVKTGGYPHDHLTEGPALTNGVVTWLTSHCLTTCNRPGDWGSTLRFVLRAAYPDGRRVAEPAGLTFNWDDGNSFNRTDIDFVASDTHFALIRAHSERSDEEESGVASLRAGGFGEASDRLVRCESYGFTAPVAAMVGSLVAYDATPCETSATFTVRDLDSGDAWQLAQPGRSFQALKADGGYAAAYAHADDEATPFTEVSFTVFDLEQHAVAYELGFPDGRDIHGFDVAGDGSLAVLTDRTYGRCNGAVTRYSSSGEATSTFTACELLEALPDSTIVLTGRGPIRRVVEVGLDPNEVRTLVELGTIPLNGADADGGQLAWAVPNCAGGGDINLDSRSPSTAATAGRPGCSGLITSRTLEVRRSRWARIGVRCARGCTGVMRLRVDGRPAAGRHYSVEPGRGTIAVRVRPALEARLRRRPVPALARLFVRHRDGDHHVVTRRVLLVEPGT
jgi:hypothetical protein